MPAKSAKVEIRRTLTGTPLSRQYQRERFLRRRAPVIPWDRFDPTAYPAPALALAVDAGRALATGEYGAVDAFARVASTLARNGAPFDLVSAATRIPSDELRHTEYALRLASLCAGQDVSIEMQQSAFDMPWGGAVGMEELDLMMLQLSTISETLAAALIDACRERATDPVARAMYGAITRDEVHHLRLGWYYFAWREPQWTQAERQRVADAAGLDGGGHRAAVLERTRRTARQQEGGQGTWSARLGGAARDYPPGDGAGARAGSGRAGARCVARMAPQGPRRCVAAGCPGALFPVRSTTASGRRWRRPSPSYSAGSARSGVGRARPACPKPRRSSASTRRAGSAAALDPPKATRPSSSSARF